MHQVCNMLTHCTVDRVSMRRGGMCRGDTAQREQVYPALRVSPAIRAYHKVALPHSYKGAFRAQQRMT